MGTHKLFAFPVPCPLSPVPYKVRPGVGLEVAERAALAFQTFGLVSMNG